MTTTHIPRVAIIATAMTLAAPACRPPVPIGPKPPAHLASMASQQIKARFPDANKVRDDLSGVSYDEDAFTRWDIVLQAGNCYYFGGAADDVTADEFSLALYDAADDRVEREREDDPPTVLMEYCPAATGTYYLEARVDEGRGHFHVAVFSKKAVVAAPPPPPKVVEPEPEPEVDLDARVAKLAMSSASGATRVGSLYRGDADETDWYAKLEAGKCYWLVGAGDDGVEELYLYLWDAEESRLGQSKAETRLATLGYCAKRSGMYHFQAKVGAGDGRYAVGLYEK